MQGCHGSAKRSMKTMMIKRMYVQCYLLRINELNDRRSEARPHSNASEPLASSDVLTGPIRGLAKR
jgi:hypothetical protein